MLLNNNLNQSEFMLEMECAVNVKEFNLIIFLSHLSRPQPSDSLLMNSEQKPIQKLPPTELKF